MLVSPSVVTFTTAARQQVRTSLELAAQRSPESAARTASELSVLAEQAAALGLASIAELARRGSEQAKLLDRAHTAVASCARTLRELSRALDALEREPAPPRTKPITERPRERGRVLIVDDSSLNAAVVCDALERATFDARHAEDGVGAVFAVSQFRPDIVLADVHMPGSTPAQLCAELRGAAESRALHILLFSGLTDDQLAPLATEAKADGFVSKDRGLEAVVDEVSAAYRRIRQ